MNITFHGAAQEVTGSCYLIEHEDVRFLVDCGMFQGGREAEAKNRRSFPFEPSEIDFVIVTHAHIDHCGLLPKLCREGFSGKIYCTDATAELLEIMLRDSAHIQEADAVRANRRRRKSENAVSPLYGMADAEASLSQLAGYAYDVMFEPGDGVKVRMRDAGHILGSAILEIWLRSGEGERKIVFSGDLGQPGRPILRDPETVDEADYLIVESTYGDRLHQALEPSLDELVDVINHTIKQKKGNVFVPAFAVGRTQELIYYLHHLTCQGRLENLNIFLDSPMAQQVTRLTAQHLEVFDGEARKLAAWRADTPPAVMMKFTESVEESIALNAIRSGAIIIAASGMCTAGRIVHHLRHGLPRAENMVLITGYQAQGTTGRALVDGASSVRIFNEDIPVKAEIRSIGGFSAHGDQNAILNWLSGFKDAPRQTFITHGEPEVSRALQGEISRRFGWRTSVPRAEQIVKLT